MKLGLGGDPNIVFGSAGAAPLLTLDGDGQTLLEERGTLAGDPIVSPRVRSGELL